MKLIIQIILILLIASTVSICTIKPELHKSMIVYDSSYTLVSEQEVQTETKEIPIMEIPATPVAKTTVVKKEVSAEPKTIKTKDLKKEVRATKVSKPIETKKQTVTKQNEQPKVTQEKKIVEKPVQKVVKEQAIEVEKNTTEKVIAQPQVVTQQQEIIAWNIWRSNLTNQIMRDTKLPSIPTGTVFQFSFNVDKYGKITNVQTGANPANYTPYAIQYIAPVIRSYQGHSILNFPEGTARVSTQVTGKWRISGSEKYSTPQDYNDVEKITK